MAEFRFDFWNNPLFDGIKNLWNTGKNYVSQAGQWFGDTVNSLTGKRANDISAQNLQAQKEELDYQHALQEQIFEREDTGYQRAVADARAAGLSANSITGAANAGGVVSTTAPQQEINNIGVENGLNVLNMINSVASGIQQLQINNRLADSEIAQKAAETSKTLAEVDDLRLRNPITRSILQNDLLRSNLDTDFYKAIDWQRYNTNYFDYNDKVNNYLFKNYYGLNSGMTQYERQLQMTGILNGKGYMAPFASIPNNQLNTTGLLHDTFFRNNRKISTFFPDLFNPDFKSTKKNILGDDVELFNDNHSFYKDKLNKNMDHAFWSLIIQALQGF